VIAWLSVLAFVLSAGAVRAFLAVSRRRLLDPPGARSSHSSPTPTGGGFPALVVFLAVTAAAVHLGVVRGGPRWWAATLCASALALLGLVDDAHDLPRSVRYVAHIVIAAAVVRWVGHPGPGAGLPGIAAFIGSVVLMTGFINAFNFMDGIDALVAGTGVVIVLFLAWITAEPAWLLLAASYCGFLVFNIPPARIFMGDAGSTALGGLVGVAVLSGRAALEVRHLLVFAPLVGDSAYTILRRLIRRENVFRAHHSHIYQRLLRAGHSHGAISGCYACATIGLGLLGAWGSDRAALAGAIGCAAALIAVEVHIAHRRVPFTRPQPRAA
jgi:UDP-N-acetylmuramyl pentapeptide phosphotransferase/UDP-N-acetylglucosamine-1-phosphate transferase